MKKMKWTALFAALLCATLLVTGCGSSSGDNNTDDKTQQGGDQDGADTDSGNDSGSQSGNTGSSGEDSGSDNTGDTEINVDESLLIKLNDANTDVGNSGAVYEDCVLRITKPGVYRLQGKLTDGQIYISVNKNNAETVELILDGCEITCKTSAAIYCDSADKLYITANGGTQNVLSDGLNYIYPAVGTDEPNACIFSDDDITLRGEGTLTVNGNFNNGISSKNDIKIKDLTLTVNADNTGIRGKDSVEINSGNVTVIAGNDGIKSSQDAKTEKGYVEINGGTVRIDAADDAIQAYSKITVSAGKVTISAGGKSMNCDSGDAYIFVASGTVTEK